jgi:hypothetical protein
MDKVKKSVFVLSILLWAALPWPGHCQTAGGGHEIKTIHGVVAAFDWVSGKLDLRTAEFGRPDEMNFLITNDTQVLKGADIIQASDINLTDTVTIEYYSDDQAGLKVTRVLINI